MQKPTPARRHPGRIRRALAVLTTGTDPQATLSLEVARIEHRADCVVYQAAAARQLADLLDAADTARASDLLFA